MQTSVEKGEGESSYRPSFTGILGTVDQNNRSQGSANAFPRPAPTSPSGATSNDADTEEHVMLQVVSLSAFGDNAAVATSEGRAFALGKGRMGQLGTGNTKDSASFVQMKIPDGEKAAQVAVGGEFTVVLTQNGKLYSCGSDTKMQVGLGRDPKSLNP
jgi:alpha-tubulin suppressor-like RCC1 family protein